MKSFRVYSEIRLKEAVCKMLNDNSTKDDRTRDASHR